MQTALGDVPETPVTDVTTVLSLAQVPKTVALEVARAVSGLQEGDEPIHSGKCLLTARADVRTKPRILTADLSASRHTAYERAAWAEEWKKRTFDHWDSFLVTPAAGNFRGNQANPEGLAARIYPGLGIARFASALSIVSLACPTKGE